MPGSKPYVLFGDLLPARTPGPTGWNDAGDPSCRAALGDTPGSLGINDGAALAVSEGPQTFAPAAPGSERINELLLFRNRQIEEGLLSDADNYYRLGDLRWFFTYAHGQITRQINDHVDSFQRPNALMRLNIHFAEQFIRAVGDQPHAQWKRAFEVCAGLQHAAADTPALVAEAEFCGAAMAAVHIKIDLRAALNEVGCIPPEDYGNMLVFVNRGALASLVRLRGQAVGAAEAILNQFVGPLTQLEVKTWRNATYMESCRAEVPDPSIRVSR